jgi:hypothetical protein
MKDEDFNKEGMEKALDMYKQICSIDAEGIRLIRKKNDLSSVRVAKTKQLGEFLGTLTEMGPHIVKFKTGEQYLIWGYEILKLSDLLVVDADAFNEESVQPGAQEEGHPAPTPCSAEDTPPQPL